MAKNKGGRPTSMTDEVLGKLEYAFSMGCTDLEASLYADINPSTLYKYQNENHSFIERKETLKQNPVLKARETLMKDVENVGTAKYIVDKADGKAKQAIDVNGDMTMTVVRKEYK